jgi:hypothetical protein
MTPGPCRSTSTASPRSPSTSAVTWRKMHGYKTFAEGSVVSTRGDSRQSKADVRCDRRSAMSVRCDRRGSAWLSVAASYAGTRGGDGAAAIGHDGDRRAGGRYGHVADVRCVGPEDVRQRSHPEVDWGAPVRMRNRIVHGYWSIDVDVLTATARDDLPVSSPRSARSSYLSNLRPAEHDRRQRTDGTLRPHDRAIGRRCFGPRPGEAGKRSRARSCQPSQTGSIRNLARTASAMARM